MLMLLWHITTKFNFDNSHVVTYRDFIKNTVDNEQ